MEFKDRVDKADKTVKTIVEQVWQRLVGHITIVPYGYENRIEDNIRNMFRYRRTQTAKHIRFTPDFFVIDQKKPISDLNSVYLLDYKATQTPIYSPNRINLIRSNAGNSDLDWPDIGQMEADAYDNYISLHRTGIRVAILNYCAYHPRLLLYDFVENIKLLHRGIVTIRGKGSGTPFINFDCNSMRTLDVFLSEVHNVQISKQDYEALRQELQEKLPITHDPNSPHHPDNKNRKKY